MKRIETDVLVVGGGLAGLRAACDAPAAGARVTLAVSGRVGRSGSSAITSAGYSEVLVSRWAVRTVRQTGADRAAARPGGVVVPRSAFPGG